MTSPVISCRRARPTDSPGHRLMTRMDIASLHDLDVAGKTVLLRADFNVPLEPNNPEITSEYDHRLRAALPTVEYLLEHNCKVVLCSHLGRPKGRVVEALRLKPVARRLSTLLRRPVPALQDCVGPHVAQHVSEIKPGEAVLLENLRFHAGEESNDPQFVNALASLADIFVLDAFGAAHRAHASIVGLPRLLPSAAGLLLQRELEVLDHALESPRRPLAVILGGAKVSDKLKLIDNLVRRADLILIGGGMAATFLKAQGKPVGRSIVEDHLLDYALELIRSGAAHIHLPIDVVAASEISGNPSKVGVYSTDDVPQDSYILDIGPRTVQEFCRLLSPCQTIIWNGPLGVFEYKPFAAGTAALADHLASLHGTTIIGGGSTASAVETLGLGHRMDHVSSGGGAMIEFLEGKELPGISALPSKSALLR